MHLRLVPSNQKYLLRLSAPLVSGPTLAASVIATPALKPPSGGGLRCFISNSSSTKTIEVKWGLYNFDGEEQVVFDKSTLQPFHNIMSGVNVTQQSTCVAIILKGSKANLRVTLVANDSSGNVVAAVQGE